jgi:hypothetical protein
MSCGWKYPAMMYLRMFSVLGTMSLAIGFLSVKDMPKPEPAPDVETEETEYYYEGRIITTFEEYDWYERHPEYSEDI